jgi:hypothetical protein
MQALALCPLWGFLPHMPANVSQGGQAPYEQVFEEIQGGSRAESRRARGLPAEPEGLEPVPSPASADGDFTPEPVLREDTSPLYQQRADPKTRDLQDVWDDAPPRSHGRGAFGREANAEAPAITGLDAIEEANRMRQITSPHKRYLAPSRALRARLPRPVL